ncbi:MAG TPA: PBSX family phage terminase large subunit, partial [Candidatus Paceibacterota bacterium]
DNPFLDENTISEIEQYKELDENYWNIYGLGQRGVNSATIYPNWKLCDDIPEDADRFYGLDFGYNNKTALIDIGEKDKDNYADELIYESHLTNSMLIERMNEMGIDKNRPIYADAAEKQRIEEIKAAGYNIISADKEVEKGIDSVKSSKFYITKRSVNMQKEARSYMWKQKDGKILDEPVKANDHAMDAVRYGIHTRKKAISFIGFV